MTTTTPTFTTTLWHATRVKLLVFAAAVLYLGPQAAFAGGPATLDIGTADPTVLRAPADGSATALLREHHCWTGLQPLGTTLGSTVVTLRDGHTVWSTRPGLVARALDEAGRVRDDAAIVEVHGFCANAP